MLDQQTSPQTNPRLRLLDFQPVQQYGESMWLLRDPWQLGERQLLFPAALAQMLPAGGPSRGSTVSVGGRCGALSLAAL